MQEQHWIKTLLTPLSWLYGCITGLRNFFYNKGLFSTRKVPQFVISVGNLTVGGTGKTPVIEYLANTLLPVAPIGILSRGYGRKTTGFLLAEPTSNTSDIGDEPLQFFQKLGDKLTIAVCEKRVSGANEIAQTHPDVKILLLDDAYQHRAINRQVNILLNDYNRPFYQDQLLPAGRLREYRTGAKRADAVIVTKCPQILTPNERTSISGQILRYTRTGTPIFFAHTVYAEPLGYNKKPVRLKNVKMVAGIANPAPFAAYLDSMFNVVEKVTFPDHHNYTVAELEDLIKYLKNDTFVVTTEKDMVKLAPLTEKLGCAERFAYIPVSVNFGEDTARFTQWIGAQITGHL